MANQYRSAFQEAAEQNAPMLKKLKIKYSSEKRTLTWRTSTKTIRPYTNKAECLRIIRNIIAAAAKTEEDERIKETQSTLL